MKLQNIKKGFTLIELLVVITIIGILATGGIGIFTKQLQGARDTTRINNLKLLETANMQYFSDNSEFVLTTNFSGGLQSYVSKWPADPVPDSSNVCWSTGSATPTNNVDCGLWYGVDNDSNGLSNARYRMYITFEKAENAKGPKAAANKDGGTLSGALEVFGGEGGSGTTVNYKAY